MSNSLKKYACLSKHLQWTKASWTEKHIHTRFRCIITDQKRRQKFETREHINLISKTVLKRYPSYGFNRSLRKKYNKSGLTQIRNRCILTGHATGFRNYGLSRIMLRKYAGLGQIPGMTKATHR